MLNGPLLWYLNRSTGFVLLILLTLSVVLGIIVLVLALVLNIIFW